MDTAAPRRVRVGRIFKRAGPEVGRPSLTLRVGVTGHRAGTLRPNAELTAQIGRVLTRLTAIAHELTADARGVYAAGPPALRLISPLASGADQMLASEAVDQGYELHCPLPFARKAYFRDFATRNERADFWNLLRQATRVLELDGSRTDEEARSAAYLDVGRVVLRYSDVLVAIWDGLPTRGVGGTAQIVDEAALLEIPVIWINAASPHAVRVGTVSESRYAWSDSMDELMDALKKTYHLDADVQRNRLLRFYGEPAPRRVWGWLPRTWARIGTVGSRPPGHASPRRTSPGAPATRAPDPFRERVDDLANHYAGLYRTAFLGNFLLSAVAVFLALVGYRLRDEPPWGLRVVFVELVTVGAILLTTLRGAHVQWHVRWLDYRLLAERLRQVKVTAFMARVPATFRSSVDDAEDDPRRDWTAWLLRAVVRNTGFPNRRMDPGFLGLARHTVLEELIRPQIAYHREREHVNHTLHHRLHVAGTTLFVLTGIAISTHLVGNKRLEHWAEELTTFAAIFLPALGAALAGILSQGEYLRTALQSTAMLARLERLERDAQCEDGPLSSQSLGQIVEAVSELMTDELLGWRVVFRGKPLTLPS